MAFTPRSIDAGVGIGEVFLDKYRVDSILGHGGMGVVALCTHLALNERVAIKMLRKDVLDDADAVERFMREAQAAAKLKSEFVARVSDVGRSDTNVPYMVMEYLEGHDLGELLDERGSLALPWAVAQPKNIKPDQMSAQEFQTKRQIQANGMGGLPLVGTPDKVAAEPAVPEPPTPWPLRSVNSGTRLH